MFCRMSLASRTFQVWGFFFFCFSLFPGKMTKYSKRGISGPERLRVEVTSRSREREKKKVLEGTRFSPLIS